MIYKLSEISPEYKNVDYRKAAIQGPGVLHCTNTSVAGTTEVYVRRTKSRIENYSFKYEVRVGIAVMGVANPQTENPFDLDFKDNYAEGKGYLLNVALKQLDKEISELSQSLFY